MYQTRKTYIKPDMKMSDLIFENPSLLIMLEHFDIDLVFQDKSVSQICRENQIREAVFLGISNLYNGFTPSGTDLFNEEDVVTIISFLQNSHKFYLNEKIPEIQDLLDSILTRDKRVEVGLVKRFFLEYYQEVKEHLDYEDEIAFPYFHNLIKKKKSRGEGNIKFSVKEYREHHTDIETKVADMKKLFVSYISLKNERLLKRKLLFSLFELEYDLNIHSVIEELILIPLIRKIEKELSGE